MLFFGWNKTRLTPADLACDVHCHLLPGVDDGVTSLDESLACLEGLKDLGYRGSVITPHIYSDVYPNREDDLRSRFESFASEVRQRLPGYQLALAAEYFLDEIIADRIHRQPRSLLSFGADRLVLIELPKFEAPVMLQDCLSALVLAGLRPVMAHVERYHFAQGAEGMQRIQLWREAGALIQVNLESLTEPAGDRRIIARKLLKHSMIDLLGSDLHRPSRLQGLRQAWQWLGSHAGGFGATHHLRLLKTGAESAR